MLKQVKAKRKRILIFHNFIYLFQFKLCSPVLERTRRGAGAGNCNGGRNHYESFCYGSRNVEREGWAQLCFDKLYDEYDFLNFGCYTIRWGRCSCTVDSSWIWNWSQTFREARINLYRYCGGFTSNIMERYEGNMYLTATCD